MSGISLIFRNLRHFWRGNLAVAAGMAVATAVLTGALMVGDSVRGSLRDLALARLGRVDVVLVGTRFFPEDLAGRLAQTSGFSDRYDLAPAVIVKGGAGDEAQQRRTAGVQIAAVGGDWAPVGRGQGIINGPLAQSLGLDGSPGNRGVGNGQSLYLNLPLIDAMPRDAALARRGRSQSLSGLSVQAARIAGEGGFLSLFSLEGAQRPPRNAWVNLGELQEAVGQEKRVNVLLVHDHSSGDDVAGDLNVRLRQALTLADLGLSVEPVGDGSEAALRSESTYLSLPVQQAARRSAEGLGLTPRQVTVYLLNRLEKTETHGAGESLHYLIAAGIDDLPGGALQGDEVALNQWAAEQLGAAVGDTVRFAYYQRQGNGELAEATSDATGIRFKIARILPMTGLGADPSLTPVYRGLSDANSIADWDPPEGLRIDRKLVTGEDERYWKKYRAAPKVFFNLETARRLWGETYGQLTSLRLPADRGEAFARELLARIEPAAMGLSFQPIKQQQLAAALGGTDFAGLFLGFSFFLLASAGLLAAMLFRLGVEQRARQIGLLGAIGFTPVALRRLFLGEGLILALVGAALGLIGAVAYTALMLAGLRTWWLDAVGTTAMRLHVQPLSLAVGFAISVLIALLAVLWGVRGVAVAPSARLLSGAWAHPVRQHGDGRMRHVSAWTMLLLGLSMIALGIVGTIAAQNAFLAGGGLLLFSALAWMTVGLRRLRCRSSPPLPVGGEGRGEGEDAVRQDAPTPKRDLPPLALILSPQGERGMKSERGPGLSLVALAIRNASRRAGRSVLTIALIAFATFILITVAAMRQGPPADTRSKASGTGGFALVLQADIPLLGDVGSVAGRELMGVRGARDAIWQQAQFLSLRSWAGQDISCLNLTRPSSPTILAVPAELAQQGRFSFAATMEETDSPWRLLEQQDPSGAIPVIADQETAQYILKLGLGKSLGITDQAGIPRRLKLVATLRHSIFQSELLMGERDFRRVFPFQSGFGTVLIDVPPAQEEEVTRRLSSDLGDYAVTVDRTADRLAAYQQVANTYLSTFQALGSLGLLLGTIGLAVVLLRNLVERRAELALLAALGFSAAMRARLLLWENAFLLIAGLLIGAVCAAIAVLPAVVSQGRAVNLLTVAAWLVLILIWGLGLLWLTVWRTQRRLTPAALRAD